MNLVEYRGGGNAVRVLLMDCGQPKYDVKSFLEEIKVARPHDYNQLVAQLDKITKHGVIFNPYKIKPLHGKHAEKLLEICARGGSRIFWFFDERNKSVVVCTHGFIARNKHDHAQDIERAQKRRALYYSEQRQS